MKEIWWEWERKARNWHRKTTIRWKEMLIQGSKGEKWAEWKQANQWGLTVPLFLLSWFSIFAAGFFLSTFHNWRCCNKLLFTVKKAFGMKQKKNMHSFVHIDTLKLEDLKMLTGKLPLKKRHTHITTEKPIISLFN